MEKIVLVDDHILLRKGLANLIESFGDYSVLFQADNGQHFISQLEPTNLPNIVLMDINMPVKDGYLTSMWLKENYPSIKVLALSMYDNENSIIKMFKAGARGYILKDCDPLELENALYSLSSKGFYYSDLVSGKFLHSLTHEDSRTERNKVSQLNERETAFLKFACTELTYKEIANEMCVSPRTIDGYRDDLFEKLQVKSRIGLVMFAIKNEIVTV